MKSTSPVVKAITLSGFTLLIICFVCYRVGAFDNFSFSNNSFSENNFDGMANGMAVDTPIVKKDSVIIREIMPSSKIMILPKKEIMSSSKSMAIPRTEPGGGPVKVDKILTPQDTLTKKSTAQQELDKKVLPKINPMTSSKSGAIFIAEPSNDTSTKPEK